MADMNFDSTEVKDDFAPIPTGEYTAKITESEWRWSKNNPENQYLALVMVILDGDFTGRKLFVNLNLRHPKDTVKSIANQELKRICNAVGVYRIENDSQELHGIPFIVKLQLSADGFEIKVKGYKAIDGDAMPTVSAAPKPTVTASTARAKPATAAAATTKPSAKFNSDDDVPF